jgi:hypothetical protein
MILISYPSGGFGNFLYYYLTEFSNNTYKPGNNNFDFDLLGTSHNTKKYTPIYFHDPDNYKFILPKTNLECLILCDNGINNDSYEKIDKTFPEAKIIRVIIDDAVRPVIYKTCVTKAQRSTTVIETNDQVFSNWPDASEDYAKRENFTLLYHNWPFKWQKNSKCINVSLENLIVDTANTIKSIISAIGGKPINLSTFIDTCERWKIANNNYFAIYWHWQQIEDALDKNLDIDLSNIIDLHDQGYINYCIEKKFNCIIPVYDYRNWFKNTKEIKIFLNETNNINNKRW